MKSKGIRIAVFGFLFVILLIISFFWKGVLFPTDTIGIVIFSTLLMLSFSTLFLEHYFTRPSDVLSSSISALLLIAPLKDSLINMGIFYNILFIYLLIISLMALVSLIIFDPESSEEKFLNKVSLIFKDFVGRFGNSKVIFALLFILTLVFYVKSDSIFFFYLFIYAGFILTDPWKFFLKIPSFRKSEIPKAIGKVFGVQSKSTFLVKLFEQHPSIRIFDFVEFKYSMDDEKKIHKGLVLDNYLLNQEQWIKVLVNTEIKNLFNNVDYNECKEDNVVYKISNPNENDYLKKFVGVVDENSNISKVRFIYNSKVEISEGQLLEIYDRGRKILYQVIQGITQKELLEHKNVTGYIVGEALQLGVWSTEKGQFEKYGWVPQLNSPLYIASPIQEPTIADDEYKVGCLPDSNYPVIINKNIAVTHHLAIIGVTGTGKSTFARNFIRQIAKQNTKVICVDFTGEYKNKFSEYEPKNTISEENSTDIYKCINFRINELEKFGNQQDKDKIKKATEMIDNKFFESIKEFLDSDKSLSIFELPDVSNTTAILDFTKSFFRILFKVAKENKNFGKRLCVVLEEAHTVIPEINFMGIGDKHSQSLVNSIGQIALQGRKYDIGFIVIAQRTANVSKTVLTQCNSIISFQEFDKTSSDFLSNYFGEEISSALPNLKFRQAIAAGKAFKSNVPMIFEVPEINEDVSINSNKEIENDINAQ